MKSRRGFLSRYRALFLTVFLMGASPAFSSPLEVHADYLYVLPCQSGLPYAFSTDIPFPFANPNVIEPTFGWESGVRVGLCYETPCAPLALCFECMGVWAKHTSSKTGPFVFALPLTGLINDGSIVGGTEVNGSAPLSKWNMELNMFDLTLKCAFVERRASLYGYMGAKGGWIDQTQDMIYDNFLTTNAPIVVANALVSVRNHFYGAGPVAGLEARYAFCCPLTFSSSVEGALLVGKINSPIHYFVDQPTLPSSARFFSMSTDCQTMPAARIRLALEWDACAFSCCSVDVRVGYEAHMFFHTLTNQNAGFAQLTVTSAGHGSLLLQGFTVGCGVHF